MSGYCLLIREVADEFPVDAFDRPANLKPYLERVIAEAMDAEFSAYQALPELNGQPLSRWFCADSPAIREILNLLLRHQKRGWVISNPMNPSTKRLLKVTVKKADPREAVLTTMEYWYLRWWDLNKAEYTYPYRETNRQMYILKKDPDGWKVFENLRPSPRTSVPHRRMQRRGKRGVE